ncbi:hypothetical protein BV25DRAFT_1559996 [Artomyces pyxidatus]|uniref:Uncharacterized protein n=1 Tax=Artomyces pyxidatus TaxID=48021 RepID=A0ACB8SKX7_9AGAM|nr:hypothetical protein BV25DRAFT_1559996 [Artomyces pyxidatus]
MIFLPISLTWAPVTAGRVNDVNWTTSRGTAAEAVCAAGFGPDSADSAHGLLHKRWQPQAVSNGDRGKMEQETFPVSLGSLLATAVQHRAERYLPLQVTFEPTRNTNYRYLRPFENTSPSAIVYVPNPRPSCHNLVASSQQSWGRYNLLSV